MVFNLFKKKKVEEPKVETTEIKEEPKVEQPNYKKPLQEIENKIKDKRIIEAIKKIKDPEIDIDIWHLELIYNVELKGKNLDIKMTFTSPMCPYGPQLVSEVKRGITELGYQEPNIEIVFSPPWEPSEEVKEMLGVA